MKEPRIFNFSKALYMGDVTEIPRHEVPLVDPKNLSNRGTITCFEPTREQAVQLALIIWQAAVMERNKYPSSGIRHDAAEEKCKSTRGVLTRLLLPYVNGKKQEAMSLYKSLCLENKEELDKYVTDWKIISRPSSIWIEEDNNSLFVCQRNGKTYIGLNPWNFVFVYSPKD